MRVGVRRRRFDVGLLYRHRRPNFDRPAQLTGNVQPVQTGSLVVQPSDGRPMGDTGSGSGGGTPQAVASAATTTMAFVPTA